MGLRARSIKKYVIEYGNYEGFNYDPEGLEAIIITFCESLFCGTDGYPDTNVIWEVSKAEFEQMVDKINKMTDEEFSEEVTSKYSRKEVLTLFKGYLKETPQKEEYVRIAWL